MDEYKIPNPDYPTGLIDQLKRRVTPRIIRYIARSDYGAEAPEHKAAIRRIIDEPRIPRPMQWEPGEPFRLTRWWDPENHKQHEIRPLSMHEAHIARAFSSACLIAGGDDSIECVYNSLLGLIESLYEISPELLGPFDELIRWAIHINTPAGSPLHFEDYDETVPCRCALLMSACMRGEMPDDFISIVQAVHRSGELYNKAWQPDAPPLDPTEPWIGRSVLSSAVNLPSWIKLARRWLLDPPKHWDAPAREACIEIGNLMIPYPRSD